MKIGSSLWFTGTIFIYLSPVTKYWTYYTCITYLVNLDHYGKVTEVV